MAALLEVQDLRVRYGQVEALHGVSLTVGEGEIVALLGANGAGKTTTLGAVSGLVRPSGGRILLDGKPLDGVPGHARVRMGLAQAPEGRRIFGTLTVAENLALGAFTREDPAEREATASWIYELFPVLRERRAQLAGTLSGGEQQMLAIGRALMAKPRVLLLDEPSLGLAPLLVRSIFDVIRHLHATTQLAVVLVEQNARAALKLAHRAYVLEVGKIALSGDAAALASDPQVQRVYLGGHAHASKR